MGVHFGDTNAFVYESKTFPNTVFGLTRVKRGNPGYLLVINTGDEDVKVDLSKVKSMSEKVTLHLKSIPEGVEAVETEAGTFDTKEIELKPKQSVVFTFVPNFENAGEEFIGECKNKAC